MVCELPFEVFVCISKGNILRSNMTFFTVVQREGVIFGQNAFSNISSCQTPYTQYRETIENSLNPGSDEEAWFVTTHSYAFLWHHHHSLANLNRPD